MRVEEGQSWDSAMLQMDRGLYHLGKKRIEINLIPVTVSQ